MPQIGQAPGAVAHDLGMHRAGPLPGRRCRRSGRRCRRRRARRRRRQEARRIGRELIQAVQAAEVVRLSRVRVAAGRARRLDGHAADGIDHRLDRDLPGRDMRAMRAACVGMARGQLGPLGQLEVGEVESGRDRATEQAVRRIRPPARRRTRSRPGSPAAGARRPRCRGRDAAPRRRPSVPAAARRAGRLRTGGTARRTSAGAGTSSAARASPGNRSPCWRRARRRAAAPSTASGAR